MTKQRLGSLSLELKRRENRFFLEIAFSSFMDIVLAAFYFIQAVGFFSFWRFSSVIYYALLLVGKVNLLIWARKRRTLKAACKTASIALILTGVFATAITYEYIIEYVEKGQALAFPKSVYLLNGTILILRMLSYSVLQGKSKEAFPGRTDSETALLIAIGHDYTWAEYMIAFSLLFTNLIVIYRWGGDKDLVLTNFLQGQLMGLIILAMGIKLLLKTNKSFR